MLLRARNTQGYLSPEWTLLEKVKSNEAREIMEVIEARDRTGSLILCSQFAPSAWHAKLGNGAIADAVIDRIVYKSYTIHIEGEESMRRYQRELFLQEVGHTPPFTWANPVIACVMFAPKNSQAPMRGREKGCYELRFRSS